MFFQLSQEVQPLLGFLRLMCALMVPFQIIAGVCAKELKGDGCNWLVVDEDMCFFF